MTIETSLNPAEKEFLFQLYKKTGGDQNRQVDSAAIGTVIGIDKAGARKVSEELIGHGFAAVKTLSGGIGITAEGLAEAERLGLVAPAAGATRLPQKPVLDANGRKIVEAALADLKTAVGQGRFDFESMAELVTDIKTIEVQLLSPKPKTDTITACLRSMLNVLKQKGVAEGVNLINSLIGPAQ